MSPRHTDTTPGWIKRRFAKIEKQMREDRAAKSLQAATIGKGGLTIRGGRVTGRYSSGRVAFEFGQINASGAGLPGDATYGFRVVKDEDSDGITTNALAEIFQSPDVGRVTRFFGADFFTATGTSGAILSAGDHSVSVIDGGGVTADGGTDGVFIVHSTTGASANCFIDPSDSRIWRSTSSRRYKRDIEDVEVDPTAVLDMQPRTWRDKAEVEKDPDTDRRYVGFIAEELHEIGLGRFVVYDADEKPEAIAYDRLSVALLAVLKDQDARLKALESADEAPADS